MTEEICQHLLVSFAIPHLVHALLLKLQMYMVHWATQGMRMSVTSVRGSIPTDAEDNLPDIVIYS
jgi:hypothetical protein